MIGLMTALSSSAHVLSPNTLFVLGIALFLALATAAFVLVAPRLSPAKRVEMKGRIATWWVLISVFGLGVIVVPQLLIVFALAMSLLGLREFFSLMPYRQIDRRVYAMAYVATCVQYAFVAMGWYGMFIIFLPVFGFLLIAQQFTFLERPEGFFAACARVHLGLGLVVFCLSHAPFLMMLPAAEHRAEGIGWVCFLVVGTQLNDVAQYCFGKLFGRSKVLPVVSPNKTLAGVVGGVATSVAIAMVIGPMLTPLSVLHAALCGVIIGVGGFVGDAVMSGVKREVGVKDTGSLLPGHGGVLDRIDSLIFTAPLLFHVVRYLYY